MASLRPWTQLTLTIAGIHMCISVNFDMFLYLPRWTHVSMWNTRILCNEFEANKCSLTLMLSGSLSLSLCLVHPPPSHSLSHFLDPSIFLYFSMSLFPSTFISMTRSRVRALCNSLSLALACARLCTCVLSHSKAACRIWKNMDLGYRFVRQR